MSSSALAAGIRQLQSTMAVQQRRDDSDEQLLHAFTTHRNEAAFAVLVRRHGPMVLHVCRRVLSHEQDAEDAFQATFLVLARHAAALRKKASLVSFLHGTAYRTAMKAKQTAARRRKYEKLAPSRPPADPADELSWREARALLDEEIDRLPEKYRSVFVLFHLEELSREETARRLGVTDAAVAKRLAEARKRLAQRLRRGGVELTAVLTVASVAAPPASAMPIALMAKTIQAALAIATGEKWTCIVSASVAGLVKSATAASKTKIAAVLLLTASMLAGAGVWGYRGLAANPLTPSAPPARPPAAKADDKPKTALPPHESAKTVEIQGRVLDPEGKPKAGAKLLMLGEDKKIAELGVTAADGRYAISVPKQAQGGYLIAQAEGCGIDFVTLPSGNPKKPVEFRLVKDRPIHGRIVNTEGKPVPGVRVAVDDLRVYANNSMDSFLAEWKKKQRVNSEMPGGVKHIWRGSGAPLTAQTDAGGRFALHGVGVERLVCFRVSGGGIANTEVWIVNRQGFDPKPYNEAVLNNSLPSERKREPITWQLHGPDLSVVTEAEKPIRGTVKELDTGKGRPGVLVLLTRRDGDNLLWPIVEARTDAQGRFEIHGARKAKRYMLEVGADTAAGYMPRQVWADDTPGYQPITADIAVKKGVLVTGKLIDGGTGKSIRGHVVIAALISNPFVKDFPAFNSSAWMPFQQTSADGTFRLVSIPGPVLLMGQPNDFLSWRRFKPPVPDPKYPEYFRRDANFVAYYNPDGSITPVQGIYCKVLKIEPDAKVVKQDIVLERAPVLPVRIEDGDGKPLRGAWVGGSSPQNWYVDSTVHCQEGECPVYQLEPGKLRLLVFFHPGRKLTGTLTLQGDEKTPVAAKLRPAGSIKGRLLDLDGKPLAGVAVGVQYRQRAASDIHKIIHRTKQQIVTDANGAFAVEELIPEQKFDLSYDLGKRKFERTPKLANSANEVEPAECRDLGAIQLKPANGQR